MKKHIIIAIVAVLSAFTLKADPISTTATQPPQLPLRLTPIIVESGSAAVSAINQISLDGYVIVSGSQVAVGRPNGVLITSGSNAGKIQINLFPAFRR